MVKATFEITETSMPSDITPQEFFRQILFTICENHKTVSVEITKVEPLFPESSEN